MSMNLGIQLNQGMNLEQNLSPQMLQSLKMLQMTSLELDTAISEELETNPLLEADEAPDGQTESIDTPAGENSAQGEEDNGQDFTDARQDGDDNSHGLMESGSENSIDWEKYMEDGFRNSEAPYKDLGGRDPDDDLRPEPTRAPSMQEVLQNQLREWKRPKRIVKIVEYLIGCIDEKGFLCPAQENLLSNENAQELEDPDIREVEDVLQNKKPLESASEAVQEAFHVLQSFTPPGIGARDLRECLLIQAYRTPDFSPLAIQILENRFDDFKNLRYPAIAKALNVSTDAVQKAVREISTLSPSPGFQINNAPAQMIVPDMEVVETESGTFQIVMRRENIRHLHINETYRKLLLSPNASKKDKDFVRQKLTAAKAFINSVGYRFSTIELVMDSILKKQQDFFVKGPKYLKPMVLNDIAEEINRDPSTVQRAVNGKYVKTPYGTYELKDFFSSGVAQSNGTKVGKAEILDDIREIVAGEDRANPLSDDSIVEILKKRGIGIARRTVAKYRDNLGILPASKRKFLP